MPTTNAFVSYAHADEKVLSRLRTHLAMLQREGNLSAWTDHSILPGAVVSEVISANLEESAIFIALLSPDYLASNYCYEKEFKRALVLNEAGKLRIVPVVIEPCDWLFSSFQQFLALPKDGQAISLWTNQNTAFLDVVTGLRRILTAPVSTPASTPDSTAHSSVAAGRRPRVKQDFDSIQKAEYADKAYETIKSYFSASCDELNKLDDLRAKFEVIDGTSFTCTVVNRARMQSGEAHITVSNSKQRGHFGDISYLYQRYATASNSSNGAYSVAADDYNLFLTSNGMSAMMTGNRETKLSPEQAAEELWNNFVKKAGIDYE